jgi:hypothetical protein
MFQAGELQQLLAEKGIPVRQTPDRRRPSEAGAAVAPASVRR